jgi:hypothetical protein
MSDHFVTLIPTSPYFVPDEATFREARRLFATFITTADQIEGRVTGEVTFVDQGANFERVSCPSCHRELTPEWWQEAMDTSHASGFQSLNVITPCCAFPTSLNELEYHWPAGFARCWLRARNPQQKEVPREQIRQLEDMLGTALREIWTHY